MLVGLVTVMSACFLLLLLDSQAEEHLAFVVPCCGTLGASIGAVQMFAAHSSSANRWYLPVLGILVTSMTLTCRGLSDTTAVRVLLFGAFVLGYLLSLFLIASLVKDNSKA